MEKQPNMLNEDEAQKARLKEHGITFGSSAPVAPAPLKTAIEKVAQAPRQKDGIEIDGVAHYDRTSIPPRGESKTPLTDDVLRYQRETDPNRARLHIKPAEIFDRDGKLQATTADTIRSILGEKLRQDIREKYFAAEVAELVDVIVPEFNRLNVELSKWSPAEAEKKFHLQAFEHTEKVVKGEDPNAEIRYQPGAAIQEEYRIRRAAIDKRLLVLTARAVKLALPIRSLAFTCLASFAMVIEEEERAEAAKHSLPFEPSSVLKAHWALMIREGKRDFSVAIPLHPRQMLAGIVDL